MNSESVREVFARVEEKCWEDLDFKREFMQDPLNSLRTSPKLG